MYNDLINFDCNAGKQPAEKVIETYLKYINLPNIYNVKTKIGKQAQIDIENVVNRIKNMTKADEVIIVNSASIANEIITKSFNKITTHELSHASIKGNVNNEDIEIPNLFSMPACDSNTGNILSFRKKFKQYNLYSCKIFTHLDASQYWPFYDINMKYDNIDIMTISPHKFHGLKGVAFLCLSNRVKDLIKPIRTGTLDYGKIISTNDALDYALSYRKKMHYISNQRNKIISSLLNYDVITNLEKSLPWCLSIKYKDNNVTDDKIYELSGKKIIVGGGSACSSKNTSNIIRISFDNTINDEKINYLINELE